MKRLATALVILLVAAVSLAVVRATGTAGPATDHERVASQLEKFRLPDGRIAPPRPRGTANLESTGWAWLTIGTAGATSSGPQVDVAAMLDLRDSDGHHDDLWEDFYIATAAHESGSAMQTEQRNTLIDSVLKHRQVQGFFAEDDDPQRTGDPAHRVMATWAAISTLTMMHAGTDLSTSRAWLERVVSGCVGNPFLLGHAVEALGLLGRDVKGGAVGSSCSAQAGPNMRGKPVPPTTEEQLLQLHGEIFATPASEGRKPYANVLKPRLDWSVDPWWVGHAVRAYVAAGGDPKDYRPLAEQIARSLDTKGLAATFEIPMATAESDLDLIRIAQAIGLDPGVFVSPSTLIARSTSESRSWSGPDWAQWIQSMKALGSDIPQAQRVALVRHLEACVTEPVLASTFRTLALCSGALMDLGQPMPRLAWGSDAWAASPDAAVAQCAAVLMGCAEQPDVKARLHLAVTRLLAAPASVPTPVLAALPKAAQYAGQGLTDDQFERVSHELDVRRGPGQTDALYRLTREAPVIDFSSTSAVLTFYRQDNR